MSRFSAWSPFLSIQVVKQGINFLMASSKYFPVKPFVHSPLLLFVDWKLVSTHVLFQRGKEIVIWRCLFRIAPHKFLGPHIPCRVDGLPLNIQLKLCFDSPKTRLPQFSWLKFWFWSFWRKVKRCGATVETVLSFQACSVQPKFHLQQRWSGEVHFHGVCSSSKALVRSPLYSTCVGLSAVLRPSSRTASDIRGFLW